MDRETLLLSCRMRALSCPLVEGTIHKNLPSGRLLCEIHCVVPTSSLGARTSNPLCLLLGRAASRASEGPIGSRVAP